MGTLLKYYLVLSIAWVTTVMMCMGNYYSISNRYQYVIKHDNKITYFKLHCPEDNYKLVTEDIPSGTSFIKEFPNATKSKNIPQ